MERQVHLLFRVAERVAGNARRADGVADAVFFDLFNRPLSKPGKGIRFLEFVSLPPPQPSPTGEGAVLRQIQITAAVLHMDSYETIGRIGQKRS